MFPDLSSLPATALRPLPVTLPAAERTAGATLHEQVYQALRGAIMCGRFVPGRALTIRGVAAMLGTSLMPVREALRRLVAERALELLANRRVSVPCMTPARFDELCAARLALEPLAAVRALAHIDAARLAQLRGIDAGIDAALAAGEVERYLQLNQLFHLTLYRAGQPQVLIPLIESLWLQFGPFMRATIGHIGASYVLDRHVEALAAIERRDALALRLAIESDIRDGMGSLGHDELLRLYCNGAGTADPKKESPSPLAGLGRGGAAAGTVPEFTLTPAPSPASGRGETGAGDAPPPPAEPFSAPRE